MVATQLWQRYEARVERGERGPSPELAAAYRDAWHADEGDDRLCVLDFIYETKDAAGLDLILSASHSADFRVARRASSIAFSLIFEGFDFGPTVRQAFEDLAERFPELDDLRWAVLKRLDKAGEGRD